MLSLCPPACWSLLSSPAGSKLGPLASNKMQLLAEHQVCSWLLVLSACNPLLGFHTLYDSALGWEILVSQVHSISSPKYLTSGCLLFTPGTHWLVLTLGLALFAYYYRSQSIPFPLQQTQSNRPQETVDIERGNMSFAKLPRMGWCCFKVYVCQKPALQGRWGYSLWVICTWESLSGGLKTVSYDFFRIGL